MYALLLLSFVLPVFCAFTNKNAGIKGDGSDQAFELLLQLGLSYEQNPFNVDNSSIYYYGSTSTNGIVRYTFHSIQFHIIVLIFSVLNGETTFAQTFNVVPSDTQKGLITVPCMIGYYTFDIHILSHVSNHP